MLNLAQIEAFIAIVETQGFRGAAERLGCSQPTISQQLRKLEESLGVTLIVRDRTQSTPTMHGERLLPLARSLFRTAARAKAVVIGKCVTIGASSNIGIYLLPPFVAQFSRLQEPRIAVDLKINSNPHVADALTGGEIDVAVMEWWDKRPGFVARPWQEEPLVVIVAPDHPWAKRKFISREQLFDEPMIGGEPGTGTGTLLQKLFGKNASRMRISMTVGSTEAVKTAVKANLGVSLVFASAVEEEVEAGSLRALPVAGVKIEKQIYVIIPEDTPKDSPAHRFASFLGSHARP